MKIGRSSTKRVQAAGTLSEAQRRTMEALERRKHGSSLEGDERLLTWLPKGFWAHEAARAVLCQWEGRGPALFIPSHGWCAD